MRLRDSLGYGSTVPGRWTARSILSNWRGRSQLGKHSGAAPDLKHLTPHEAGEEVPERPPVVRPRRTRNALSHRHSYVTVHAASKEHAFRRVHDGADASASLWSRPRHEPMREVRVDGEGLTDAQLLHDDEAQTVHRAIGLILVSLEEIEGRSLFVGSGPMDARQFFAIELIAEPRGLFVADLARKCDRFGDDVVCCEQMLDESQIREGSEDFDDALMVGVSLRDEREEESRVEEDQTFDWP